MQYVQPLSESLLLIGAADVNYTDDYYSALDLDANTRHDSYTKVNARIALESLDNGWSLALIGKNLTDEDIDDLAAFYNSLPVRDAYE